MTTLTFSRTTSATPEQFLAALTDFGPGRSELFANSADDYLEVHDQGPDKPDLLPETSGAGVRLAQTN